MIRGLLFAAIALALGCGLGALVAERWVPQDVAARRLLRAVRVALGAALVVQVGLIVMHGRSLRAPADFAPLADLLAATKTRVGQVSVAEAALLALALGLARRPRATRGLVALLVAAAAGTALSGHAATGGESAALSAAALVHATLAALWFGCLGPLWYAHRVLGRDAWAALLRRFSALALPAMLAVLASGGVLATWSVGRWAALVATPYGLLLMAKLALVAVVIGLAAWLRGWLARPRAAGDAAARRLALEAACACGIVALAGTLAGQVPAAHDGIVWPFGFRLAPAVAWQMQPVAVGHALLGAAVALMVGGGIAACMRRGHRRLAWASGIAAVATAAALVVPAVAIDAYPTSYAASKVGYETASVVEGARLYASHCTACHGAHGRGDGPLAARLAPRPANLTEPHLGWHTHGDMYWWLTNGYPGSAMPGFAQTATEVERWDLINYLTALSLGHQARNLGTRPVARDPWLAAIDFRFRRADGSWGLLSELRGREAALLVLIRDKAELARLRALEDEAPRLAAAATRVIVVVPGALAPAIEPAAPMEGLDLVVDTAGEIAPAWALYRRTLAAPDFRDEQPAVARLEFLIDRFGFVRARWRSDEPPGAPTAAQLLAAVDQLAREPELASPDVHAH